MNIIKTKLRELTDVDVKWVSMVDAGSSRIPIRIIKRGESMIDLSSIRRMIKGEDPVPSVSAVLVPALDDDKNAELAAAIKAEGFSVDKVSKTDGDKILVYEQTENPLDKAQVVAMSGNMFVAVKGFNAQTDPDSPFEDAASSNALYQSADSAMDVFFKKWAMTMQASDNPKDAKVASDTLCDGFKSYIGKIVSNLPQSAFKAEAAVQVLANKWAEDTEKKSEANTLLAATPEGFDQAEWEGKSDDDKIKSLLSLTVKVEDKPAEGTAKKEEGAGGEDKLDQVLASLEKIGGQVTTISGRVDTIESSITTVKTEVSTLKSETAGEVAKLTQKMSGVVLAPSPKPDAAGAGVARKADSNGDLRTGAFDSAYLTNKGRPVRK